MSATEDTAKTRARISDILPAALVTGACVILVGSYSGLPVAFLIGCVLALGTSLPGGMLVGVVGLAGVSAICLGLSLSGIESGTGIEAAWLRLAVDGTLTDLIHMVGAFSTLCLAQAIHGSGWLRFGNRITRV